MIHETAFIHPAAHVAGVTIGARTRVWQNATVSLGTVLGDDCNVGACAVLTGPIFGNRCKISSGVVMGPGFKVGDDVFLGPGVVLCNDMWPGADAEGYDNEVLRAGDRFAVIVGNGAIIGAGAIILPGVRVGEDAVVAAGAVVDRNVPDTMVWRRNGYLSQKPADWKQKRMRWAS